MATQFLENQDLRLVFFCFSPFSWLHVTLLVPSTMLSKLPAKGIHGEMAKQAMAQGISPHLFMKNFKLLTQRERVPLDFPEPVMYLVAALRANHPTVFSDSLKNNNATEALVLFKEGYEKEALMPAIMAIPEASFVQNATNETQVWMFSVFLKRLTQTKSVWFTYAEYVNGLLDLYAMVANVKETSEYGQEYQGFVSRALRLILTGEPSSEIADDIFDTEDLDKYLARFKSKYNWVNKHASFLIKTSAALRNQRLADALYPAIAVKIAEKAKAMKGDSLVVPTPALVNAVLLHWAESSDKVKSEFGVNHRVDSKAKAETLIKNNNPDKNDLEYMRPILKAIVRTLHEQWVVEKKEAKVSSSSVGVIKNKAQTSVYHLAMTLGVYFGLVKESKLLTPEDITRRLQAVQSRDARTKVLVNCILTSKGSGDFAGTGGGFSETPDLVINEVLKRMKNVLTWSITKAVSWPDLLTHRIPFDLMAKLRKGVGLYVSLNDGQSEFQIPKLYLSDQLALIGVLTLSSAENPLQSFASQLVTKGVLAENSPPLTSLLLKDHPELSVFDPWLFFALLKLYETPEDTPEAKRRSRRTKEGSMAEKTTAKDLAFDIPELGALALSPISPLLEAAGAAGSASHGLMKQS